MRDCLVSLMTQTHSTKVIKNGINVMRRIIKQGEEKSIKRLIKVIAMKSLLLGIFKVTSNFNFSNDFLGMDILIFSLVIWFSLR